MRSCDTCLTLPAIARMVSLHLRDGLLECLNISRSFLRPWSTRALTALTETPMCRAVSRPDNSRVPLTPWQPAVLASTESSLKTGYPLPPAADSSSRDSDLNQVSPGRVRLRLRCT